MTFVQDLRFAWRRLGHQPGFAIVVALTLAVGLGANTTVFTLVHALMLRSLPVERPGELYRLGDTTDCCVNSGLATSYSLFSFRLFEHLKGAAPDFSELAGFQAAVTPFGVRRRSEPAPRSVPGAFVTANYFAMFGVTAAAGRLLQPDDDRPGAPGVAVLSYQAWSREYGRDPSLVGETVTVAGRGLTIVGISAERFFGDTIRPNPAALWIPIGQEPAIRGAASLIDRVDQNWLYAIGRLRPGSDTAALGVRVTGALQQWLSAQPFITDRDRPQIPRQHIVISPAGGGVGVARLQYARSLTLLFAASGLVLLITTANLANLLLARADRGQAAIRAALGASRGRLIRQALAEGVLLSLAGALVGVELAALATRALVGIVFPLVAFVPVETTPAPAVWLFALVLAVVTGALFTAAPAWAMSGTAPLEALAGTGRNAQPRSFVPRGSLVVVQVALSLVLLSSAGLLSASLGRLEEQPLGFEREQRVVVRFDPPALAGDVARLSSVYARFEENLRRVPGVVRVGIALYSPMEDTNWSSGISIAGRRADPDRPDSSSWNRVTADWFETLGTRVVRGRAIDAHDTPTSRRVAVVNESFVRRFFDRSEPIGRTVGIGDASHGGDFEIVGVVEDVKYAGASNQTVRPMLFLPAFQTVTYADATMTNVQARATQLRTIVVQMAAGAGNVEGALRQALAAVEPDLNVNRVLPLTLQVSANFRIERLMTRLTSVYGIVALALAALGLYGVTAYGVSQRTREIGVRMALGADPRQVMRTIAAGPLLQTGIGLILGVPGALAAGRALGAQLYGVSGLDLRVVAAASIVLLLSALAAAALPAHRAASVNPAVALRGE